MGNFRGLEASRPRTCLRGQGLQDVSSSTSDNLCFRPLPIKNLGYVYGYLPAVTVTFDVIGQFYVRLFFRLELVLVMIRAGAKFRL